MIDSSPKALWGRRIVISLLKIAICDDNQEDAAALKELICKTGIDTEIALFESGEAFLAEYASKRFDIVFLDIYMGGVDGVETARELRKSDKECQIVFTTQSTDHALDGYGVDAMQYLVKPDGITGAAVEAILSRSMRLREKRYADICTVVSDGKRFDIPMRDILYAEAYDKQCHIHVRNGDDFETVIVTMKFSSLAAMLQPPRFYRSHRSYIVNLEQIAKIREDIIMTNGDTVYMRRGSRTKCEIALNEWRLHQAEAAATQI